jgi:hypothetical protein
LAQGVGPEFKLQYHKIKELEKAQIKPKAKKKIIKSRS